MGPASRTCCEGLKENDYPDHSCPHPKCCGNEGPVGVREYASVMGAGWSWGVDRGIGRKGGLRGDATYCPVTGVFAGDRADRATPGAGAGDCNAMEKVARSRFWAARNATANGRIRAGPIALPFGDTSRGPTFLRLSVNFRIVSLAQASEGAQSFDGGRSAIDIGYHGKGSFTQCLLNGTHLCGCGYPLDVGAARRSCAALAANSTYEAFPASGGVIFAGSALLWVVAAIVCVVLGVVS